MPPTPQPSLVMRESKKKHPFRILVVEDDPDILNALNIILGSVGFDVDVLLNGKTIVMNQFVSPDLFIIDKRLPDIDGLDVLRFLKSKPSYRQIPVIVISASAKQEKNAYEAGATRFIEKPFVVQELLQAVSSTLNTPLSNG